MPITKGQEFDQVLPYPEMGWKNSQAVASQVSQPGFEGQGQNCMMPMPSGGGMNFLSHNHHHHHQGVHGGQGFHINAMPQYPQQPSYCILQPNQPLSTSHPNVYPKSNPPPPEENLPLDTSESHPGVEPISGTTINKLSCKSCFEEPSPTQPTTGESEFDEDEDYSEANSFWPKH